METALEPSSAVISLLKQIDWVKPLAAAKSRVDIGDPLVSGRSTRRSGPQYCSLLGHATSQGRKCYGAMYSVTLAEHLHDGKSGNAFAVSKSMGHADLKSMEPYQHQELEPLRIAINQRNRRKKFGQVLENAS
jgi:hypothetical protein